MTEKENRIKVDKKTRFKVAARSQFLQGSWNYERMQNGGYAFSMIPAIKKLYKTDEDRQAALKRHMEFFNTTPFMASPIIGVTLALEEERANGGDVDDEAINGVKVGMMGPLAGVGDPVFWFTVRPILGALCASLAMSGNILGPIMFFVVWNLFRWGFQWYTQEFGYKAGSAITDDLSGTMMQDVTRGASMLGMFVLGSLIQRWVKIDFKPIVSKVQLQKGAYIDWHSLPSGHEGIQKALELYNNGQGQALSSVKITTMQNVLDQLIPGLAGLLLTFLCMWLDRKSTRLNSSHLSQPRMPSSA